MSGRARDERADERRGSGRGRARRSGAGLLSTLVGAGLLVVLGFALGVVAGLVLEEPALLFDYVAGRATSVPIAAAPSPALPAPADVAAGPPPAPARSEEGIAALEATAAAPAEAPAAVPAEAPEPEPPPAAELDAALATDAPPRGFAVQVGAFADPLIAEELADALRNRGFAVYVAPTSDGNPSSWRVRVGPLATRAEAEEVAQRLERDRLPTWVLAEDPR